MKIFTTATFSLFLFANGQMCMMSASTDQPVNTAPAPSQYQTTAVGANFNVWQYQTLEPIPDGQMAPHIHSYNEIASGLNHLDVNGSWVASSDTIEAFPGGAIVRNCQHSLIFSENLNSSGAVDMQTADGNRIRSNLLGLMLDDPSSGTTVQIAQLQDSEGQLIANNEVLYTNALQGQGFTCDVLYRNRIDGMEQNVIIKEQPLSATPSAYGMNPDTTYLEAVTEFLSPPQASVADLQTENSDAEESDQMVSWGATSLGRGKAFILGNQDAPVKVIKRYVTSGGRFFLFERVRWRDVEPSLAQLPQHASNVKPLHGMAFRHFEFPKGPSAKSAARPMRLALGRTPDKGYVLDYSTLNSAFTNYLFQAENTYYISGAVNLYGTNNVFEGGSVIKYASGASLTFVPGSKFSFQSLPYFPVIITSKDDNTSGDNISGATGSPSGYYADPALNLGSMGSVSLSEFHIGYANRGLSVSGASPTIYDAQFVNCAVAVSDISGTVNLRNALFSNVKTNFNTSSSANTVSVQNATFRNNFDLVDGSFSSTSFYLTNCVFVNATNLSGTISAGYNGFYQSPKIGSSSVTNTFYPLQVAGAASCYFTNGCVFANAGTINVDPNLVGRLAVRTTRPPTIYSNVTVSVATTLNPVALRDTNAAPDLGYHYDALDYCVGGVHGNSNITFTAGTAVGWFELPGSGGNGYGISLNNNIVATFSGTVTAPCVFARYSNVQEEGNGLWKDKGFLGGIVDGGAYSTNSFSMITANFTHFYRVAYGPGHMRDGPSGQPIVINTKNCEFYGGFGGYNILWACTNSLLYRADCGISTGNSFAYQMLVNCTFYGGSLNWGHSEGGAPYWYSAILNCAFDNNSGFSIDDPFGTNTSYANYNNNAFLSGASQPPTEGTNTISVTSFNWQSSWFGNYYQTTNSLLIDKGYTTADQLGLYHFTTQTNQMKETNSIVDIGYHYVATDAYGNPLDTNGDGTPDYLEDSNGDGVFDTGDLGEWQISPYGLNAANGLQVFTPLK